MEPGDWDRGRTAESVVGQAFLPVLRLDSGFDPRGSKADFPYIISHFSFVICHRGRDDTPWFELPAEDDK
jgi:hypothetical protein